MFAEGIHNAARPNPGPRHGPPTARHAKSLRPRRHCRDRLRAWGYGVVRPDAMERAVSLRNRVSADKWTSAGALNSAPDNSPIARARELASHLSDRLSESGCKTNC
jgi:hypothetical protein